MMNTANARFAAQWSWAVVDRNGHVINRFRNRDEATTWARQSGTTLRVKDLPTVAAVDIF